MSANTRRKAADMMIKWLEEEQVEYQRDFNDPGVLILPEFFRKHTKKIEIGHNVRLSCDLSNIPHLKDRPDDPWGIDGVEVQVLLELRQGLEDSPNEKLNQFVMKVCNLTNPYFKYVRTIQGGMMVLTDFVFDEISFQHLMYKIASYAYTENLIKSEKFGKLLDASIAIGFELTDEMLEEHFGIPVARVLRSRNLN